MSFLPLLVSEDREDHRSHSPTAPWHFPASGPALPQSSIPLTFYDVWWLGFPPVERVFFYRLAPDADLPRLLSNLKGSLSTALRAFFPLAGNVRLTPGAASTRHDIFYAPGDGVPFTVAEYEYDGADLASHEPRQVADIAQLAPRLPGGGALLAVQATVLRQRRGLALGVTLQHAACDGAGSTNFLHTWAATCAGAEPPAPPVIDRALIGDHQGLYDHYAKNMISSKELESVVKLPTDQLMATFTLSGVQLQSIKDAVAGQAVRRGQPPPRCSSLVAALGFIWCCHFRAKAGSAVKAGGFGAEETYFSLAVDHRRWSKPPVPTAYLGNCIGPAICTAPKKELALAGASSLLTACAVIAAGIEKAVAAPEWETLMERIKEVAPTGILSVAGSPRFLVYGLDFGFGRPVKVEIVSVARTGAVAVAECGALGTGLEMGISLPPAGMKAFQRCFSDALACLL
ncbi:malonyl-CoA:anthocyanidin 5-O-glucoside-6''-O-malonyltransferase-like [Lolium rigidum]|uniref:malonyl-CoA:anthocyanidin 5-O-glucoside-6''-O-malonyltransferase-like n=1 Tax=Lolium rigidum TaxID=89674 RepID=UPI001F5D772B|nr:malonyl-CoA:anthocyanidin 5-O-glucoside-6''-O-malonyltransferase-like [Lolium rigidum]